MNAKIMCNISLTLHHSVSVNCLISTKNLTSHAYLPLPATIKFHKPTQAPSISCLSYGMTLNFSGSFSKYVGVSSLKHGNLRS